MSMQKVPETPLTCEVRAALEEYTQRLMKLYHERFTKEDPEAWREEYRAECEKYGYVVVSEIKEVLEMPTTVKIFKVTVGINIENFKGRKDEFIRFINASGLTIHGDIEEREMEA